MNNMFNYGSNPPPVGDPKHRRDRKAAYRARATEGTTTQGTNRMANQTEQFSLDGTHFYHAVSSPQQVFQGYWDPFAAIPMGHAPPLVHPPFPLEFNTHLPLEHLPIFPQFPLAFSPHLPLENLSTPTVSGEVLPDRRFVVQARHEGVPQPTKQPAHHTLAPTPSDKRSYRILLRAAIAVDLRAMLSKEDDRKVDAIAHDLKNEALSDDPRSKIVLLGDTVIVNYSDEYELPTTWEFTGTNVEFKANRQRGQYHFNVHAELTGKSLKLEKVLGEGDNTVVPCKTKGVLRLLPSLDERRCTFV
ncbi:hypothetical protein T439DRAFT_224200 [Meredithblackwellia eburnea MCA 4105]